MTSPPAQFYTPPGCTCIGVELLLREYFDNLWQAKRAVARGDGAAHKNCALVRPEQAYIMPPRLRPNHIAPQLLHPCSLSQIMLPSKSCSLALKS